MTVSTGIITTIAGSGSGGYSGDGGLGTSCALYYPTGAAVDSAGNVYIVDYLNNRIRKVTIATDIITTIAGTGASSYSGDNGPATSAALYNPIGLALDASDNVYIADLLNNRIRKVTASTGMISTFAGTGSTIGDGMAATTATLSRAMAVSLDTSGNIYIADTFYHRIRKVTVSTGIVSTFAGSGTSSYSGDGGDATAAALYYPYGVTLDSSNNVYIADRYNHRVRKVTVSTGIISTIAGTGTGSYGGDGGAATAATLYYLIGLAADSAGNRHYIVVSIIYKLIFCYFPPR